MTKPADIKKTPTGRLKLASIVKQAARVVGYLLALAVASAVVASCQSNAFDCNAQPEVCL